MGSTSAARRAGSQLAAIDTVNSAPFSTLLDTTTLPHDVSGFEDHDRLMMASLDHAMWFHRPFRADDWLLYDQKSPSVAGSRGFARGSIYTRDGRLVVSVAQEGLVRVVSPR